MTTHALNLYFIKAVWMWKGYPGNEPTAFTARRYASAVYAVVVGPSVRRSDCHMPVLYQNV